MTSNVKEVTIISCYNRRQADSGRYTDASISYARKSDNTGTLDAAIDGIPREQFPRSILVTRQHARHPREDPRSIFV